jgi:hypothetical protein
MAILLFDRKQLNEALKFAEKSLLILMNRLPADHPNIISANEVLENIKREMAF